MSRRAALISFVAVLLLLVVHPWSTAAVATSDTNTSIEQVHCLLRTEPSPSSAELIVLEHTCFPTFEQVLTAAGVPPELVYDGLGTQSSSVGTSSALTPIALLLLDFTLGVHYENANSGGSSLTVSGSNCGGGYLNLSSDWNNRISSTANGCSTINHFDGTNMSGTSEATTGTGGNLSTLDNRSSSIQYTT